MRLLLALPLSLSLGLLATPASAEINWDRINLAEERAAIEAFQRFDQRLQDTGWKLVRGNVDFCPRVIPSVGLQLQDLASYGSPEVARRALGLTGDFAVQTAAAGSPSAQSGQFSANREVTRIGGDNPNGWEAGEKLDWQRLTRAHDFIDASLADEGAVTVAFADGASAHLTPVPACATRFELLGEGKRAVADGERVVIGIRFPGFAYPEDLFAGAVAHELAHNLLRHSQWLDRHGRRMGNVRRIEREADRLMPWLLANAGYDPSAAVRFMEEWGPRHDGGLLRDRSHDGWDERAEFIAGELAQIEALLEETGKADWATHFRREIDPDS
ncbi:hypothetical protein [uncultured Erythrobacter sp.]|uniref:hypothetical protein n=1 Tax=uncultured Erythrobacter sp. TaxID=263913 RepID=UPI00262869BB|nr:hypothetical protein [uncultured Erythrobacter sp.]